MPLPDLLPIPPFTRPVRGEITLPGSKSITNRALLLAALCDQPVTLTGALFSEDTHLMATALRKLGFTVEADERALTLRVADQAKGFPESEKPIEIFVGLAGTAARFLTALCAAAPHGVYLIDGVPQMRKRPMKGLIEALRALQPPEAKIRCLGEEGFLPLEIHARGLRGGAVKIDASESSQLFSALLMVAPLARSGVSLAPAGTVRAGYVDMTAEMMRTFMPQWESSFQRYGPQEFTITPRTKPYHLAAASYAIEPDASAASYFLALPLVTSGELSLLGARDYNYGLQGDTQFADVVRNIGAQVQRGERKLVVAHSRNESLYGIADRNFHAFSDTFLTLAAIAPLLQGATKITGIAHTRKQETDRVAGMAAELRKLGQDVDEHKDGDGLTITPQLDELKRRTAQGAIEIETYGDHRFAMSFGILGCRDLHGDGRPWLTIRNPACCAKTFPHFFELLETLRKQSLET